MLDKKELNRLFKEHNTSADGLTTAIAAKRLDSHGPNAITEKKKKPLWVIFLEEFKDILVIILIFAAILALIAGETADGIVILFVVFLNATIGFIQTFKAEKAIEALKKLIAPHAHVIRDGKTQEVDAKDVVPGDILVLNEGDSITADAILIDANELEVAESALTGESMPVRKSLEIEETGEEKLSIAKENMVFTGTNVTHGTAKAIVVATGMETEMGRIAKLTTETKKDLSPLEKEMFRIGVFVGKIALVISGILFVVGYFFQGKEFVETLLFASSVAVAAVPEGLPATITIALAIGVQRLAKKNAIVKQLSSAETLGSTTVICSDKTGTLTKNEMTVKELYFNHHEASVHGVGYIPTGYINIREKGKNLITIGKEQGPFNDYELTTEELNALKKKDQKLYFALEKMMQASALCNNATLENKNDKWRVLGDPTEGALLTMVGKAGFDKEKMDKQLERVYEMTFDSTRKRMSVVVKDKDGKHYIFTKGAPGSIIEISSHMLDEGKSKKLSEIDKIRYIKKSDDMAKKALRGLGFAYREMSDKEVDDFKKNKTIKKEDAEKDLIFLGLVGMIDPPRPEVKEAVKLAKKAHLRIYIITGDHGLTAAAIAEQLGIISKKRKFKIITGVHLNKLSDEELQNELADKKVDIIFARVSPEHKLRIVKALKHQKEIVAVTGDGVNDAPALKKADIGIAMGITGTDVSKEASNMVLADDSFSSIITAINEGRTIYNNLKKFVFYMFSCNIGELLTIFTAIIFVMPPPLTAILILAVNLGTDVLPAVALGVDPAEPGIMDKKPRDPNAKIMNKPFIIRYLYLGTAMGIIVMGVYIFTLYRYGWTWGEQLGREDFIYLKGSTVAFASLIVLQMIQAFNSRSERHSIFKLGLFSNMYLFGAIALSLVLTFIFIEVPFLQQYLHTTTLDLSDWSIIILASLSILVLEEVRKYFVRRKQKE